ARARPDGACSPPPSRAPNDRCPGASGAAPQSKSFPGAELPRHKLSPSTLALVGFSQGTMMSLHVGLRRPIAPAAIVGYSGMLVLPKDGPAQSVAHEIKSRPPVLLAHGDQDELIPPQALFHAAQGLAQLGVPFA